MSKYIMVLDQGTTSSRAILFNKQGEIVKMVQQELKQYYPEIGWVEQDPLEIWATQSAVINEVLAMANISPKDIKAIGITNQRETTLVWDRKTGNPVYNAIVWQCRRTAEYCKNLASTYETIIKDKTGLTLDPYFSASKIRWILDNVEGAQKKAESGDLIFGTVDSWLLYKLTHGVHKTDMTNASRTMLYNIHTLKWDEELLDIFNIPKIMLPEVNESGAIFGYTNIQGYDIPITAMVGDQQASLFGQQCFKKGDVKNTYGTGCFILMNTKDVCVNSKQGLLSTIGISFNGSVEYALEGSVFMGGAIIKWLRDKLNIIENTEDISTLVLNTKDNEGVYFVPAFTGLGAPYWDSEVRGSIFGMTQDTSKETIARAALESIAYQTYDVIKAMEKESNIEIQKLKADGGASVNNFLMQFQANILNCELNISHEKETTARGCFYIAGLQSCYISDISEASFMCIHPQTSNTDTIKKWHKAIKASQYFSKTL